MRKTSCIFRPTLYDLGEPEVSWINPGFCTGSYLPIYSFSLCTLSLPASLESLNLIADLLWNHSDCWGNIQGIICPSFSLT